MNGQQYDFFMGKSSETDYVGRVRCPCCGNHSQVRAKVVAEGSKKFFAGTVQGPPPPKKNTQLDMHEAFHKLKGSESGKQ